MKIQEIEKLFYGQGHTKENLEQRLNEFEASLSNNIHLISEKQETSLLHRLLKGSNFDPAFDNRFFDIAFDLANKSNFIDEYYNSPNPNFKSTPLISCIANSFVNGVAYIIKTGKNNGLDINSVDKYEIEGEIIGHNALTLALIKGSHHTHTEKGNKFGPELQLVIDELFQTDIDKNHQITFRGHTALHMCVFQADYKNIEKLLSTGAKPNIRNSNGQTPYEMARNLTYDHAFKMVDFLTGNLHEKLPDEIKSDIFSIKNKKEWENELKYVQNILENQTSKIHKFK